MSRTKREKLTESMAGTRVHEAPGWEPALRVALCLLAPAIIAGLAAYYLLASRGAAGEFGYPLDDSWIHVRFAQHLARGQGFSFNPGEPTSTTTGALWTVLLAAAYRVTHEFLFTSAVVNGLLSVLLCLLVYQLALTIVPSRWVALVAGLLVAVTAPLPWWVLSGMESPLYAALAVLGVWLHVRERRPGGGHRNARPVATTMVLALAGLARPECLLLFPLAMLDGLIMARWVDREERAVLRWAQEMAWRVPLFAVLVAPLFLYNYQVTGYPLPSSFYSKQQWISISGALASGQMQHLLYVVLIAPWRELGSVVATWARDNAVLIGPFFVGLVVMIWETLKAGPPLAGKSRQRSLLIPMLLMIQPMAWAVLAGYRPADFQSQRYLASLNPLYLLVGLIGGWWLTERAAARVWRGRPGRATWLRAGLAVVALAASLARQPAGAATYALNVKNTTEMQVTIGRWLREHAPRGSLLALNDVGAIAVITDDPVLDLQGLVTPQVLALRDMKQRLAGTAPAALSQYLFSHRPDYLVIFPEWYPELDQRRDLFTPVFGVRLEDNITAGRPVMVVYRTVWAKEHGR